MFVMKKIRIVIKKLRELIDMVILSDHKWKKKYYPILYSIIFKKEVK